MSAAAGRAPGRRHLLVAISVAALAVGSIAGCGGSDDDTDSTGGGPAGGQTKIGFNEAITPADSAAVALIADAGVDFVRVPMSWVTIEPTEGARNWAPYDAINEVITDAGLKPLWVLTAAPCWAADRACAPERPPGNLSPTPERVDDYAAVAAEVAERYPDSLGLEIWNEPNIPNFWGPTPDASLYRDLLTASADAVHSSGSDVPVVMAGPSPTTDEQAAEDPLKIPFVPFIEQVMQGPDAPDVDAIGLHPYSLLQVDADPVDESVHLFDEGSKAAGTAAPGVPVWVTEVGLTTAGKYAIPEDEQADGLERIVAAFADARVPVVGIHRFFDQADPPLAFEKGFGVVASDRTTPKPSFCSAADAIGAVCTP